MSSDATWKCHAFGVSSLLPRASSNGETSKNNPTNLTAREIARMPSSPTKSLDPLIDHTHHYAFPPISTADAPGRPPTAPLKVPAFESMAHDMDAGDKTVPLNELHIQLGRSNSQTNFDQNCEGPYREHSIVDPSLLMDPFYENSSYLPIRETISPYLLDYPEEFNYCNPASTSLHDMASFNVGFGGTAPDSLPALTCNLASPQIGGSLTTPKSTDTSPLFSVHDTDLALDGLGLSWSDPLTIGQSLPPDHAGLESLNYLAIHGATGLQPHGYPLPSQFCPHLADSMVFDGVWDPNAGHLDAQFGQNIPSPPDQMYNIDTTGLFQDNITTDWRVHSTESPNQDASRRHSKGRSAQRDTSKDELLVSCKAQGMSYKQIKELGGFDEAESTLRGRYRALTKPREARLRKPEWGKREIELLFEGVAHFSKSNADFLLPEDAPDSASLNQLVNKIPWKQVAEYMESRGTYRYGNWTVKKKYMEILKSRASLYPARPG
ncbi:uncharacterized protein A1O9_04356 [Exophiala aquamarina CBS 119918]|uniref:Myb-like domain-containing protein n=1 Tax=Exophiala aquamarina CBS 119918 TaxID=1182545 RepID=A0A072PID0_9EURO|nr:uncharacterized protein A1O9_04356 [Exophiala aquamarina CBS 119918]KEF59512.1 hypothetical protein A1O9_04356 [Exophiala aquamarina CBS 119918]